MTRSAIRLQIFLTIAAGFSSVVGFAAETSWSPLERELLGVSHSQLALWAKAQQAGAMEVQAVHLPEHPKGDCNHFGWPIATMAGDSIVVMHRRIPGHNPHGAGKPNPAMSYGIVLRSTNGGKTWSQPYDLRDCMKQEDRTRGGIVPPSHRFKFDAANKSRKGYMIHLHAIGTTRDGTVVAINNHGVFHSKDAGATWKHFSKALREDTFEHELVNLGPRLVDSAEHGLMAFGNWFGKPGGKPKKHESFVILQSRDGGGHWSVTALDVGFKQYEPAVLPFEDRFLFVTRNQTDGRSHRQVCWNPPNKVEVIETNLTNPRLVDTVDFSYNPIMERFEIVRSERHHMELWLWSMQPKDWKTGKWTRECRLLKRQGRFYGDADGFHPAGAVIDAKRGVQHVFFYSGHPNGPAGVFRMTRSLDTRKLQEVLTQTGNEE